MAIGATLGFKGSGPCSVRFVGDSWSTADGVGYVRGESDTAQAIAANRLLLRIDGLATGVVAAHMDSATTASRSNSIPRNITVARQHKYIVAQGLKIIGSTVSSNFTEIVKVRAFYVRFLRQVAAETTWIPATMTTDTGHVGIIVWAVFEVPVAGTSPNHSTIVPQACTFGRMAARIVMLAFWPHRIGGLSYFPPPLRVHRATLNQLWFLAWLVYDFEFGFAKGGA